MKLKLIIARTETNTIFFNYGDDYSDVTRILVEDHSQFEEIEDRDAMFEFVRDFNRDAINKNRGLFAFIIDTDDQISPQSSIDSILEKRRIEMEKSKERERKAAEVRENKKREREIKKLAKTKEAKLALLEQLKKELE